MSGGIGGTFVTSRDPAAVGLSTIRDIEEGRNRRTHTLLEMFEVAVRVQVLCQERGTKKERQRAQESYDVAKASLERTLGLEKGKGG